ncbi:hypothetical protein FEDK69T_16140 [Flavobacterium enshiense DK69]|uniref:Periplasmic heavy metal sensor n=1 Tax=Flavobacterium enshiense DK69 TaxID=1107311 RepID=V6S9T9_9FLAO|nr:hypothetical protein [Flavobacterium enshiense]ESU23448.1 hypothetical protein FEDK69T_16140 [Flavobacterium enshiense DK69]KGO96330.1 hypothetical protein Q767_05295 [Flavobacterium enshiense DK69]
MKNVIIAVVMMISLTAFAQDRKMRHEEFTLEQKTELQVKKMTLELDLNDKQQKNLKNLLTEQNKKREEAKAKHQAMKDSDKKLTSDELFAMKNKMLDDKIAFKADMKKILSEKQMEKWEELKEKRMTQMREQKKNRYHKKH